MDFRHLRSFLMVARSGQLNQAASRLGLTSSALSIQIKNLEDELGVALFHRSREGMKLTPAGKALLPLANGVVEQTHAFVAGARRMRARVSGRMSVGTITGDPDFLRLGTLFAAVHHLYPELQLEAVHGVSGWVWRSVRSGLLDSGFFIGCCDDPGMGSGELRQVVYRVVAPVAWRDKVSGVSWEELVRLPWIWAAPDTSYQRAAIEFFLEKNLELPRRAVIADDEATIVNAVRDGVGLSLMREHLARQAAADGKLMLLPEVSTQL